ncbi:MAG: hypothetical protein NZ898_15105, partial [Myxococcota bacterium]|nr:hypothetical protein [Myxococcota bacterium]
DFTDTRLTVTFGDDDVLSPTGEQVPLSPRPGFGDRPQYSLFFDNLNSRFSSRETLTHLVVYRKMAGFDPRLTTEAAIVVRLNLENVGLSDTGTYLRLAYRLWPESEEDGLSAVLFPFDSDRMRLGYLYALSFGGAEFVPRRTLMRAPGLKLQLDRGAGYYFVGFKAIPARVALDVELEGGGETEIETVRVSETQYSVLAGAGWDVAGERLRVEFGAGFFQQGVLDLTGYPRVPVYSMGGAARIAWRDGIALQESIDFALYRNDPNHPFVAFRPVAYEPGRFGWLLSAEANYIVQHLADIDRSNATTLEGMLAAAGQLRLQYGFWRGELTVLHRDLGYILKNRPSYFPFLSIPDEAIVNPELFVAMATDYHFARPRLTVGLGAGVQLPATFTTLLAIGDEEASATTVVRSEAASNILPFGTEAVPVVGARLHARLDLSEMLYTLAWLQYVHDGNLTGLVVDEVEGTRRFFRNPHAFGFGLSAAARF